MINHLCTLVYPFYVFILFCILICNDHLISVTRKKKVVTKSVQKDDDVIVQLMFGILVYILSFCIFFLFLDNCNIIITY